MFLFIIKFLAGLVLIIKGADWLTDGASAIARRFNISSLVIGLTVVAFGTSAPEMVVSVISAINHQTEMSIGNVLGSNIFNTLGILGITALIYPIRCSRNNIVYDLPFMFISAVVLFAIATDLNSSPITTATISRGSGIVLLCFFAVFLAYSFAIAHKGVEPETAETDAKPQPTLLRSLLLFLLGLGCLIGGGEIMVNGAVGIAALLGVSQSIIALTIVAAGTSFPELITSIMAARKGDTDMAMGNVVGSNIFNIFFVLGVASTITPLQPGNIAILDLTTLLIASVLLWLCCRFGRRTFAITRSEAAILCLLAIAYYTYAVITA